MRDDFMDQFRCGIARAPPGDLSPWSGPQELFAVESAVFTCLLQFGRDAMQRWCQQFGDGDRGAQVSKDGVQ